MNNNLKYVKKQVGIVLAVLLFGLILFALGLVVGSGGKNPWDILSPDKWQEIVSKFTGRQYLLKEG